MKLTALFCAAAFALAAMPASADDITIRFRAISDKGVGADIGKVRAVDTREGLRLVPRLSGLSPGAHGFHVHQNPRCGNRGADGRTGAGLAAGGHFDPANTGHHEGPGGQGHLGDLPALTADAKGLARASVTAPRLRVADLWGHAIIIHAGGDNYSDQPSALGGGGARVACGTIIRAKKGR